MMDMLQTIDVGLVVLDRNFHIQAWNSFMENHSGLLPSTVREKSIFQLFPEIPADWFRHKAESVFLLKSRSFTTWEQRPFLFRFKTYRPITGTEEFMYQNITLSPLVSSTGEVNHICVIIYDVTDIATHKKQLETVNAELEALSRTDRLTQLNNRGYWEECLVKEYQRFRRTNGPSTVVMFDIDHFKKVNDTYGHQAGDEVIKMVSEHLRNNLRVTDIAGRYGGEEFGVILVNTDAQGGIIFCERLRQVIEAETVVHDGQTIRCTISLGLSQLGRRQSDYKAWLEEADQALYQSKEGGRNLVTLFKPLS
jgi:diguanylate cyclase